MATPSTSTILIHGYGFDPRLWNPLDLAFEGHRVISLALPGFGLDPVTEGYTIADLAKKYWKQLDDLNVAQVNLAGHSMGGYVCLEMLAQNALRVSSLALVHSHVYSDSAERKVARSDVMHDIQVNGRAGFINKLIPSLFADSNASSDLVRMLIRRGLQFNDLAWYFGTQAIRDRTDHSETLRAAQIPVLLLMGDSDKAVPAELAYKQASLSERTVLHMYPGVGHLGMYENTKQLIMDLIRFYDDLVS